MTPPLYRDLPGGAIDLTDVVRRQFDVGCSEVLLEVLQLRGAGDGNNPRLAANLSISMGSSVL